MTAPAPRGAPQAMTDMALLALVVGAVFVLGARWMREEQAAARAEMRADVEDTAASARATLWTMAIPPQDPPPPAPAADDQAPPRRARMPRQRPADSAPEPTPDGE